MMKNAGLIYAFGAAVLWGLAYTLDQKILSKLTPLSFLFIGSLLTALLLLPFLFFQKDSFGFIFSSNKTTLLLVFSSILLAALAGFFILSSIKSTNAATASTIEITYPFFVILFSSLLFRTVPNKYFFIGTMFIFLGSVIIFQFA